MTPNLAAIAGQFQIYGDFVGGEPYGSGHINDTYALQFSQSGAPIRYLMQRVNHVIFKDVPGLMQNVDRVTAHAQSKLAANDCADRSRRALTLIRTREGNAFYKDDDGNFWRVYLFIEGAVGHDIVETEKQAWEAASAFGEFQRLLMDLPGERLNETIPNFHNTAWRYDNFEKALAADAHNRAKDVRAEIDAFQSQAGLATALTDLNMPERVTHNDTKLNNVLIDCETHEATCVIDLDTLMPGLALHDFGDLVRTSTSPAAEDEQDLSKVTMRMQMFKALVEGYLHSAQSFLTRTEIENLPLAGKVITFEIGLRFITDYLEGDVYFKTHRNGHNIDRCRTQLALVASMNEQLDEMQACIPSA